MNRPFILVIEYIPGFDLNSVVDLRADMLFNEKAVTDFNTGVKGFVD